MRQRPRARARQMLPEAFHSKRERREYALAIGIVAALQFAVTVALSISALQTYRMWRQGVAYLPGDLSRLVPLGFAGGALVALFACARTIRRLRRVQSMPLNADRDDT